jgi:transposase
MRGFGQRLRVGVEGTGAYGAGLARLLRDEGVDVIEVDRPDRKTRRFQGKSDPIDAIAAARAALADERTGTPKQRDGRVEALRNLRVARRSAVDQRADAQRQIKALIVTGPRRATRPAARPCRQAADRHLREPAARPGRRRDPGHRHQNSPALPGPPPPATHHRNRRPGRIAGAAGGRHQP